MAAPVWFIRVISPRLSKNAIELGNDSNLRIEGLAEEISEELVPRDINKGNYARIPAPVQVNGGTLMFSLDDTHSGLAKSIQQSALASYPLIITAVTFVSDSGKIQDKSVGQAPATENMEWKDIDVAKCVVQQRGGFSEFKDSEGGKTYHITADVLTHIWDSAKDDDPPAYVQYAPDFSVEKAVVLAAFA